MNSLTPYQKEALNFNNHIALTANAGSGKTFVLANRYIEITLQNEVNLSSIVAITFTEKAASELYHRISNELDNRLINETDEQTRKKIVNVRRHLVSAKISTIHSFCAELLREYSPEAGLDANFKTIDEIESDELITESISDFMDSVYEESDLTGEFKFLVRIFRSVSNFSSQLRNMFSLRKTLNSLSENIYSRESGEIAEHLSIEFESLYRKVIVPKLKVFIECVDKINSEVLNDKPDCEYALNISGALSQLDAESDVKTSSKYSKVIKDNMLTGSGGIKIRGYLKKDQHQLFETEIGSIKDYYAVHDLLMYCENEDELHENLAVFGKAMIDVFERVLELYEDSKMRKGLIDFDDLQLNVLNLLNNPEVKKDLESKYKFIMIDEFQDTNEIQYNIFLPILDHLRSGNLFVVGDEKQSIYMFRGAEPEIFHRTREEIESSESAGKILNLPHSFRVSPKIALFTNLMFGNLFTRRNEGSDDVEYNDLVSVRDEIDRGSIEFLFRDSSEEGDTEAELVAKKILSIVGGKDTDSLNFNEIAILTRKRNSFAALEKAFNKFKIPYTLIGGKGFFQKQAINDLYNYLSFLINRNNDLALIGLLRSPFYNLSDREIFSISSCDGDSYFNKLCSASETITSLVEISDILNSHAELSQTVPVSTLLRTILTDTGYWAVAASKSSADQEVANLEKLITLSNNFMDRGFKALYDFVSLLEESIKTLEDEGQANIFAGADSVKIMTIHKAKGLEFPAVFLYGCNDYGRQDRVMSGSLSVDKKFGLLTKLPSEGDYFKDYADAPINGAYNFKALKKAESELIRLFYVAVTRAKDYLFISAAYKNNKAQKGSFLDLLMRGLNFELTDDILEIAGEQKFMLYSNNEFKKDNRKIECGIQIIREIGETKDTAQAVDKKEEDKIFLYDDTKSFSKNEIISATKISIFSQCPMKYHLTYNLGFTPLVNFSDSKKGLINFNHNEDDETIKHSDLRGLILHKLIEMGVNADVSEEWIRSNINQFASTLIETKDLEKLINSSVDLYGTYFNSALKNEIDSFSDVRSEFEIYMKENDYYLYGIIDKLIITPHKIVIIDFKSDSNIKTNLDRKLEQYKNQLHFYGYIASTFFDEPGSVELRIVFLEEPDREIHFSFSEEDRINMGDKIKLSINKIRNYDFSKNLLHCNNCHFEFNKSCVSSF